MELVRSRPVLGASPGSITIGDESGMLYGYLDLVGTSSSRSRTTWTPSDWLRGPPDREGSVRPAGVPIRRSRTTAGCGQLDMILECSIDGTVGE